MHYIRFLKAPSLIRNNKASPDTLKAKVTLTTDLGESFLAVDVIIVVELHYEHEYSQKIAVKAREYTWNGSTGIRALEVEAQLPPRNTGNKPVCMMVSPKEDKYKANSFQHVLRANIEGGIVSVRSMAVDTSGKTTSRTGKAERVLSCIGNKEPVLHIWEETGDSIARHIWDAGLLLSAHIFVNLSKIDNRYTQGSQGTLNNLPLDTLWTLLRQPGLRILELGAGCGIVGITLFHSLRSAQTSTITLTDLEEAEDILHHNLSARVLNCASTDTPVHQVLDWSLLPLPPAIVQCIPHLVVVADCTYNPDVVPDLVKTLGSLAEVNPEVMVLLAMKVRHESEMVFFDLMSAGGWDVKEKEKLALPVLGGADQEIEIFVFRRVAVEGEGA